MKTFHFLTLAGALAISGCATSYQLAVMPRDSGKIYSGTAENAGGASEGPISITIEDKVYKGTWVQITSGTSTGYVSGGYGWWGGWRGGGVGGTVVMENPQGGDAKALLTAADGSGLRCDLRGGSYSRGGGVCRDDRGREFDVQIRPAPRG
jgi:hypothetical protein